MKDMSQISLTLASRSNSPGNGGNDNRSTHGSENGSPNFASTENRDEKIGGAGTVPLSLSSSSQPVEHSVTTPTHPTMRASFLSSFKSVASGLGNFALSMHTTSSGSTNGVRFHPHPTIHEDEKDEHMGAIDIDDFLSENPSTTPPVTPSITPSITPMETESYASRTSEPPLPHANSSLGPEGGFEKQKDRGDGKKWFALGSSLSGILGRTIEAINIATTPGPNSKQMEEREAENNNMSHQDSSSTFTQGDESGQERKLNSAQGLCDGDAFGMLAAASAFDTQFHLHPQEGNRNGSVMGSRSGRGDENKHVARGGVCQDCSKLQCTCGGEHDEFVYGDEERRRTTGEKEGRGGTRSTSSTESRVKKAEPEFVINEEFDDFL